MRSYEEVLHPVGFVATQIVDNELAVAPRMVNDFPQESFICSLLDFVFTFRHVCSCLYENINVGADQNILVRAKKIYDSIFYYIYVMANYEVSTLNSLQGREKLGRWKRSVSQSSL